MPTWAEARAGKDERLRREQRLYTPDRRGPRCWVCKQFTVDVASAATGEALHPVCAEPQVMGRRS